MAFSHGEIVDKNFSPRVGNQDGTFDGSFAYPEIPLL